MPTNIKPVATRFRAYQLGSHGSSFSYFAGNTFTLLEARVTDQSRPRLLAELKACGKRTIDTLHITSWDSDHCNEGDLEWLLRHLPPHRIEYPGYRPQTDCGEACLKQIQAYHRKWVGSHNVVIQRVDPPYIESLGKAEVLGYQDIVYHPKTITDRSNDNSTVKFFRTGAFNVLSLGDVEYQGIAAMLQRCRTLCREVDVMILAHHGADNGFTTRRFLKELAPQVAVCSSNYGNHFDHPRQEIRDLLYEQRIDLFTTKTGDVLIHSTGGHTMDYQVTNLKADSEAVSSQYSFRSRKSKLLRQNADTVRAVLLPGFKGLR
ncbi:MAG: hypothetical protein IV094_08205 [Vitreoscilla sp.]|nr:hypothetical protein [Vitreoscilla sp.]